MNPIASISKRLSRLRAAGYGQAAGSAGNPSDQPLSSARQAVAFVQTAATRMARDGSALTEADLDAWAAELLQGMHEDLARKRASVEEAQAAHRRLVDLIERSDLSPQAAVEHTF